MDVRPIPFGGVQDFFLSVSRNAFNARQSVAALSVSPSFCRSSAKVASGWSRQASRRRSACCNHCGGFFFRGGRGAICPVSRRCCLIRRTQDSLTLNLVAVIRVL